MKLRIGLFVIGIIVTVSAGILYWRSQYADFMSRFERPAKFLLTDTEGDLFSSSASSNLPLQFYVFMPTGVSRTDLEQLGHFCAQFIAAFGKNVDLLLVSRANRDVAGAIRSWTKFRGRILLDPSGASGRNLGFWQEIHSPDGWHYVLLEGKTAQVALKINAQKPLSISELEQEIKRRLE